MKAAKKRAVNATEAPKKQKVGLGSGWTQVQCTKLTGKKDFQDGKEKASSGSEEPLPSLLLDKRRFYAQTTEKLSLPEHYPERILHPSGKIKLQLFPIDECTRTGLEKDGYNPHLELTLNARKKISSVIKHLNGKWGGASVAYGEPVLLPYNKSKDVPGLRWTLHDTDVSAGDVYTAIGSPPVFRLWYGWFSDSEAKSLGLPPTSTPYGTCLQPEDIQKGCTNNTEGTYNEAKQIQQTSEELKPSSSNGATDAVLDDKMPSSGSVKPLGNEVRTDDGVGQSSALWDENLTNISIGGLLSEASLQGRFNSDYPKSNGFNTLLQQSQSQIGSDSLDAFIAAQINGFQDPKPPPQGSRSSILDAEDTCHAFPIQKFSVSGNDAQTLGGSTYSWTCSQDGSMPSKFPNTTEVNIQSGFSQGVGCQESESDLSLCPRVHHDENSLGLSGIKWTDSRGPFDLGLSSSRKILSGDSLSMSRFVS